MTTSWVDFKDQVRARLSPAQRLRWDRALKKARDGYRSEIRKYRGISRIRTMYRRRQH